MSTLVDEFNVSPARVHVVHSFISLPAPVVPEAAVHSLRSTLRIPVDAFVVGGVGTIEWRKGSDLFVQLARKVKEARPRADIHYVWVGGESPAERGQQARVAIDIVKAGVADQVHFVGEHSDPWPFYHLFDVFALTSRADPFPLVALEAASVGRPVVCFSGGGGMPEFVSDGGGYCVPYLGVDEMASRVVELFDDPGLRASLGATAANRVHEAYAAEAVVPRIAELIFAAAGRRRQPQSAAMASKYSWGEVRDA